MLNQQIISSQIEPLNYSHTVKDALFQMSDLNYQQLPVVKDGLYEGLLSEDDLMDADGKESLLNFQLDLLPYAVKGTDHFLTAAKLTSELRLQLIPVITVEKEYLGFISEQDLLKQLSQFNGVQEKGALMVLGMNREDYSTGQLAKLVETNDAVITQLNTVFDEVTGKLIVTLRINKEEISDILSTFQRYDYDVIFHAGQEQYENELRRNYFHLMNFLEM
ncbi:MAG: CBS domain-containing protein [Bacteroidota bacterium]